VANQSGDPEVLKRLSDAGFVQEFHPLDNSLFVHPKEKRAAAPSAVRNASIEDVENFIRHKSLILWGIPSAAEGMVLKRLGPR
jgi:hypothetical protein